MEAVLSRFQHDEAVRLCALRLLSEGYEVRARVEGWFQAPESVNGYRPDIVARRGNEWIVIEVKKGEGDWPKISALVRLQRERTDFKVRIVSPEEVISNLRSGAEL
jgi:hypothetical protein